MAALSATAAAAQSTAKIASYHAGVNYAYGEYTTSASLSTGDVVFMVRIPMGARVHTGAIGFTGLPANRGAFTVDIGDDASASRYGGALSADTLVRFTNGLGYKYSAQSSTVAAYLKITCAGVASLTNSVIVKASIAYTMEDN